MNSVFHCHVIIIWSMGNEVKLLTRKEMTRQDDEMKLVLLCSNFFSQSLSPFLASFWNKVIFVHPSYLTRNWEMGQKGYWESCMLSARVILIFFLCLSEKPLWTLLFPHCHSSKGAHSFSSVPCLFHSFSSRLAHLQRHNATFFVGRMWEEIACS